ncbi:MAG: hypothetical protein L3J67_09105 [Hyphomicrobiaceae bacterium]|nr:hypothetical protein [Hyphomicrobiaceae bacterium]
MKEEVLVASSYCAKIPENNLRTTGARTLLSGVAERERECELAGRALHRFLLELVGLVYHVELAELLSPTRGRKNTAFARQIAMYLAHTTGGLSLSSVGRLFGRDRTTVSHACALVEDARDEPIFDRTLSHLESTISCQMELFRLFSRKEVSL